MLRQLLVLSLVFAFVASKLEKCKWVESTQSDFDLSYYLREPKHGSCHFSLINNKWDVSTDKGSYELILFINRFQTNNESTHSVLNCKINKKQRAGRCQISSSTNFIYSYEKSLKHKINVFAKVQQSYLLISFEDNPHKNLNLKGNFILQNGKTPQTTRKIGNFTINQLTFYILPILYLYILRIIKKQPIIKAYQLLQQILLLKIISFIIFNLYPILQGVFQDEQSNHFFKILLLFVTYFFIFGICIKILFDYLEQGPIQFNNKQQYSHSNLFPVQQRNQIEQKQTFLKCVNSIVQIFKDLYYEKSKFTQRIIRLLNLIAITFFINSFCFLVSITANCILVILIPAYLHLKNVSPSSEFQFDDYLVTTHVKNIDRDAILFPKLKITLYFILHLSYLISNFEIYDTNYFRYFFQIGLICLLWFINLTLIKMIINTKIGKKVFIYHSVHEGNKYVCNYFKNWKIVTYFLKNQQSYKNNQKDIQIVECCICLQEISLNEKQNKYIQTQCGHIFHSNCFKSWVKNKMICPIDRNSLNKQIVQRIIIQAQN